jgi:hypothetical protein
MVEQVQLVKVSELTCIRLTCNTCKTSVEISLKNTGIAFKGDRCPVCGDTICQSDQVVQMASAIDFLANTVGKSELCFVLRKAISE